MDEMTIPSIVRERKGKGSSFTETSGKLSEHVHTVRTCSLLQSPGSMCAGPGRIKHSEAETCDCRSEGERPRLLRVGEDDWIDGARARARRQGQPGSPSASAGQTCQPAAIPSGAPCGTMAVRGGRERARERGRERGRAGGERLCPSLCPIRE